MKRLYFILLLLINTGLFASESDSLIYFNELEFKSETEGIAFTDITKNNDTYSLLKLFLIPYENKEGYNVDLAEKKLNECVQVLQEKTKDKQEKKKIKIIHEYVHELFFGTYKLNNSFTEVFQWGNFNCVSGSAIFALILSKMDIPYQIIEAPSHVFLIAYPKTEKILLESTMPEQGSYKFNKSIIEKYVADLYASKLISREEFENNSSSVLFDKYYFSPGAIKLKDLAGIQYNNYALYALDDKKENDALVNIKKAYYLNPCERSRYLLKNLLFNTLNKNEYLTLESINDLILLFRFYEINDADVGIEVAKNEYARMLDYHLIQNTNYAQCEKLHKKILLATKDTLLKNEINFMYNYELARLGLLHGIESNKEFKHLEEAYKYKPKNANLHLFIIDNFADAIRKTEDAEKALAMSKVYVQSFDFLDSNINFNNVKANIILELAYENFYLNNIKKGDEYLGLCEKMKSQIAIEPDVSFVEKAYSEAASIYFKKGNFAKSKAYLQKGLLIAPSSFGLKQRLKLNN